MDIKVRIKKIGLDAKGILHTENNSLTVLKGSRILNGKSNHFVNSSYDLIRNELIKDKIIVNNIFEKDFLFHSPSQASSVILACSTNGKREWINDTGGQIGYNIGSKQMDQKLDTIDEKSLLDTIYKFCDIYKEQQKKKTIDRIMEIVNDNNLDVSEMKKEMDEMKNKYALYLGDNRSLEMLIDYVTYLWNEKYKSL